MVHAGVLYKLVVLFSEAPTNECVLQSWLVSNVVRSSIQAMDGHRTVEELTLNAGVIHAFNVAHVAQSVLLNF